MGVISSSGSGFLSRACVAQEYIKILLHEIYEMLITEMQRMKQIKNKKER